MWNRNLRNSFLLKWRWLQMSIVEWELKGFSIKKMLLKWRKMVFSFLISKDRVKHQVFCSLRGTCKYSRTTWKKYTLTQAHNKSKMEIEKSIKRKFIFDSFIWSREVQGVCNEFFKLIISNWYVRPLMSCLLIWKTIWEYHQKFRDRDDFFSISHARNVNSNSQFEQSRMSCYFLHRHQAANSVLFLHIILSSQFLSSSSSPHPRFNFF